MTPSAAQASAATAAAFVIQNWKSIDKSTLLGVFDLVLPSGLILVGCQLHIAANKSKWVGVPGSRFVRQDGTISGWVNVIDFSSAKARSRFQELALAAVDAHLAGGQA